MTGSRQDDSVRLGLIGCGSVTEEEHLPAIARVPSIRVVAIADVDAGRRARVGDRFGIPHRYADHEVLLSRNDIDAVGICIPAESHREVASVAIAYRRAVLIEKPPGLSLDDVEWLMEAQQRTGVPVLIGYHMRWHRLVRQAQAIIASGVLGRIESLRAVWYGHRDDRDLPRWRERRDLGGGSLLETAIDQFDLWRFLLNADVAAVHALSRSGRRDDEAAVLSGSMQNGVLVSAAFSERTSSEIEIEVCGDQGRLRVCCSRVEGLAFYPVELDPASPRGRLQRAAQVARQLPRGLLNVARGGDYQASYIEQWRHFAAVARGAAQPGCTLDDARRALCVALAALTSVATGQPVRVERASRTILRGPSSPAADPVARMSAEA